MSAGEKGAGEKGAGEKGAPVPAVAVCASCPRRCHLAPGALGVCRARRNVGGRVVPEGYGRLTSLALDPVEKKPLARWRPGSYVVSVGSYGCNLACPFCQNHDIAQAGSGDVGWREVAPDELERRRAAWQPPAPKYETGVLSRYARLVTSADKGAYLS